MTSAGGGNAGGGGGGGGGGCHGRAVTGRCLIDGVVENGKVRMQVVSTSLVAVENTCYKTVVCKEKKSFVLRGSVYDTRFLRPYDERGKRDVPSVA